MEFCFGKMSAPVRIALARYHGNVGCTRTRLVDGARGRSPSTDDSVHLTAWGDPGARAQDHRANLMNGARRPPRSTPAAI
jgi:hypothetical protein